MSLKAKLFMIAIVGSVIAFMLIDLFIININIINYIFIELIITVMHSLYNIAKNQISNNPN
jgi:hypothetical protein